MDELELISAALRRRVPVLGICRGMQMLNVGLGGGLHPDIRGLYTEVPYLRTVLPRKRVRLDPESRLARLLERKECWVNSLHHQAVEALGGDLRAVAWEDSGIVQAIEAPARPFVIGVQWHPEYMPQQRSQRRLFRALVDAARRP